MVSSCRCNLPLLNSFLLAISLIDIKTLPNMTGIYYMKVGVLEAWHLFEKRASPKQRLTKQSDQTIFESSTPRRQPLIWASQDGLDLTTSEVLW